MGCRELARAGEFRRQSSDSGVLVECQIVGFDTADTEQFGDHLLVDGGVLAHVEAAQMRPEGVERPSHRLDALVGEHAGTV